MAIRTIHRVLGMSLFLLSLGAALPAQAMDARRVELDHVGAYNFLIEAARQLIIDTPCVPVDSGAALLAVGEGDIAPFLNAMPPAPTGLSAELEVIEVMLNDPGLIAALEEEHANGAQAVCLDPAHVLEELERIQETIASADDDQWYADMAFLLSILAGTR